MTMTPVRPDEHVHDEPVTDAAEGTSVRSPGFRLALLVALVAVLVAGLGSLAYLLSTRAVDAVGIGGDQAQVQGDREAVMAQTEQFVLRFGTYGPDLLDEQGGMPDYRERVKDVITPKFAVSFDKQAGTAEEIVAKADISRSADVFATGVSAIDSDSATALVAGTFTDSYPKQGAARAHAVPLRGDPGQGEGVVARRQLHPGDGSRAVSPVSPGGVSPSWYDVLDVDLGATETEVRSAWKAAIADLEPTDRRFRLLNQAAEVLLDRDRRSAYDTELLTAELDAHQDDSARADAPAEAPRPGWVAPGWLLVAVAALAALVVGAGAVLVATAPSDASVADATRQAQSSAERAIVPILSYDASRSGDLDEDQRSAEGFMTSDYRAEYAKLFEVIKANAPETGTKVSAEVVASGIVRSGDDRVSVLVFVNRPTTNKQVKDPVVYKDQVTVTMQRVGDDWLVDDLVTSPAAG